MSSMISHALAYAAEGWPVFPVKPLGKTPLTWRGFKDATTDAAVIRSWWRQWPTANIGVPTGAASGLAVLDVDAPGGEASLRVIVDHEGPLPATVVSRTGGGGSQHFFRWAPGFTNTRSRLGRSLDTRGEGGYVILPPSVHSSGVEYRWESHAATVAEMPAWLLAGVAGNRLGVKINSSPAGDGDRPRLTGPEPMVSVAGRTFRTFQSRASAAVMVCLD